jgi:hypothetical protein
MGRWQFPLTPLREVCMLTLERLACRLASDPAFRIAFAADPQPYQDSPGELEQEALNGLRGLLALAPDRLLNTLLGKPESEAGGPPEWGVPPSLSRACHA